MGGCRGNTPKPGARRGHGAVQSQAKEKKGALEDWETERHKVRMKQREFDSLVLPFRCI